MATDLWGKTDWHAHGLPTLEELKAWNRYLSQNASLKDSPKRLQTEGFAPLTGAKDTESP